jgi:hypothetical protein
MTKTQAQQVEDAIVICIEDHNMNQEQMLKYITDTYKVSPVFVLNAYKEMYEDEEESGSKGS